MASCRCGIESNVRAPTCVPLFILTSIFNDSSIDIVTEDRTTPCLVYHVIHPITLHWNFILDGLEATGLHFQRISADKWLDKVIESSDDTMENPSKQMLQFWQAAVS